LAAYLAVTGQFALAPVLYAGAVLFWVAGFDIIYALQDIEFDKGLKLHSVPVAIGRVKALHLSSFLHLLCAILIALACYTLLLRYDNFGWMLILGTVIFIALLAYQHRIVKPDDLSKVNIAFFTTNGIASLILGILLILDIYL